MAKSRRPHPAGRTHVPAAETPGALGRNDASAPDGNLLLGDTPGPLGRNDWADPDHTAFALRMPMGLDAGWSNQNLLRNPYRFSGLFLRPPQVLSITGTPAPDPPVGHHRSPAIGIPASKLTPADT
jgi:hypothetical protein